MRGRERHQKRLKALTSDRMIRAVGAALHASADQIRADAHVLIMRGSAAGTVKGSKHEHVRSKPGEPPHNEDGDLVNGLEALHTEPLVAEVRSNALHAVPLEFGTSRMAARPHIAPARDKNRGNAQRNVAAAIEHTMKTGG